MLTPSLDQRVDGHSPLLVFADPLDTHREVACSDLLCSAASDPQHLLVFAYHRRPQEVVEGVREHGDVTSMTILSLGDGDADRGTDTSLGPNVVVEQEAAADLTNIGIRVANAIDCAGAGDEALHVCLGSITTLLQYVDVETAFKFLHVTLSRLESAGGVVHGHLDPDALDEEAIETLTPLFDSVLERADGEWTARAEA